MGREYGEGTLQADPGEGEGTRSRGFGGARGALTFFQTFPGFISETFGARRRPSFRLPGGARWGGRGVIAAPRGCGEGGSAKEKRVQKKHGYKFSQPAARATVRAARKPDPPRLAFQPGSPGPGTGWSRPPARGALPTSESEELF